MVVTFTLDTYPGRVFDGQVRLVRDDAKTIQGVVTYDAVVDVVNSEHLLKPGMTANVTFPYAQKANVLRVPNAALRFRPDPTTLSAMSQESLPTPTSPDQRVLWVLEGTRARAILVRVGISDGTFTEVEGVGLSERDAVVTEAALDAAGRSS
jgi:HlyD family secretion protein